MLCKLIPKHDIASIFQNMSQMAHILGDMQTFVMVILLEFESKQIENLNENR